MLSGPIRHVDELHDPTSMTRASESS
jgi:hypothetical protein